MRNLVNTFLTFIICVVLIFIFVAYLIENSLFIYNKSEEEHFIQPPLLRLINSKETILFMDKKITVPLKTNSLNKDANLFIRNDRIHVFYYPWYRNVQYGDKFVHWNHRYLPHWNPKEAQRWPKGRHKPPGDIGANYYPELGPYSSIDSETINKHMAYIGDSGAGVLAVSWYPPNMSDDEGEDSDSIITPLLDAAQKFGLKICLHIEPFKGRNAETIHTYLKYAIDKYTNHSAYYKYSSPRSKKLLPFFYMYDSYLVPDIDWQTLLLHDGTLSIRNTEYDVVLIGLLLKKVDANQLSQNGFDGFYTYFGSQKFTFGATSTNWGVLRDKATKLELIFVPSIAPGYVDVRVRPWNAINTKRREDGKYYESYWASAVDNNADIVSITSFNEWHEGTQIEPAIPFSFGDFKYEDYYPHSPDYYIQLTRKWVLKFRLRRKKIGLL